MVFRMRAPLEMHPGSVVSMVCVRSPDACPAFRFSWPRPAPPLSGDRLLTWFLRLVVDTLPPRLDVRDPSHCDDLTHRSIPLPAVLGRACAAVCARHAGHGAPHESIFTCPVRDHLFFPSIVPSVSESHVSFRAPVSQPAGPSPKSRCRGWLSPADRRDSCGQVRKNTRDHF